MILYIENPKDATRKSLEIIMNLVKSQDKKIIHRNLLYSHTLTMNIIQRNKGNNTIYHYQKTNKIPRN